jgi:predicted SAM-dependent methyltransferase
MKYIYTVLLGPLVRSIRVPPFPKNPDGEIFVHIGCGECNDERFINVDARAMPHVHYVTQNIELAQFSLNSIDLIYACHILEHVSHRKLAKTLSSWYSHLKAGGVLRISIPDFDKMIEIYNDQEKNIHSIKNPLLGGQEYGFNYHFSIFNKKYIASILIECGFTDIKEWDPATAKYYSFDDWAGIKYVLNKKEYFISLNIEAVK